MSVDTINDLILCLNGCVDETVIIRDIIDKTANINLLNPNYSLITKQGSYRIEFEFFTLTSLLVRENPTVRECNLVIMYNWKYLKFIADKGRECIKTMTKNKKIRNGAITLHISWDLAIGGPVYSFNVSSGVVPGIYEWVHVERTYKFRYSFADDFSFSKLIHARQNN